LIFLDISIKNVYLAKRLQVLPTNYYMLFHITGIKEVIKGAENKKHNIDILIEGDSEAFIRTFLQHHNIIVLSILDYNKPSSDF
jgi:hypothetical protein